MYYETASKLFTADRLPKKPFCSDNKTASLIRPACEALKYAYVQPNPPGLLCWLVFDIDRDDAALRFEDVHAPPPNIVVSNYNNGRAHYFYALKTPVNTGEKGRAHPIRYAEAIYQCLAETLGADLQYSRLIAKNPLHPNYFTFSHRAEPYELGELAGYVDLNAWKSTRRRSGREVNVAGRNCTVFDDLRHWAYQWVTEYKDAASFEAWSAACHQQAEMLNEFPGAGSLPASEIKAIAKSVAKFTWRRYTGTGANSCDFLVLQAKRGKLKGAKKRDELLFRAQSLASDGRTQREIAETLGVSQKTVSNWLRKPAGTPEDASIHLVQPRAVSVRPTPKPLAPVPMTPAEEKAWIYFDFIAPGYREFWRAAWNDPLKRHAVPWFWPPAMLAKPDERLPDGTRVPHLDMMIARLEANARACGKSLPW